MSKKVSRSYHGNINRKNILNWQKWTRRSQSLAVLIIFAGLGAGYVLFKTYAYIAPEYLFTYFPNNDIYKTKYIAGTNYSPSPPSAAVHWFEEVGRVGSGQFKMYNSNPADPSRRCHWDKFTWGSTVLTYSETYHKCGTDFTDTVYSPGITYMPRKWTPGTAWSQTGSSRATFSSGGVVKCTGNNVWKAEIVGKVDIAPGVSTYQVRNTQTTTWDDNSGSDPVTGCGPKVVNHYQENLYLYKSLPLAGGGVAKGVKRTVGGNIDRFNLTQKWDWDIWNESWQALPPVN